MQQNNKTVLLSNFSCFPPRQMFAVYSTDHIKIISHETDKVHSCLSKFKTNIAHLIKKRESLKHLEIFIVVHEYEICLLTIP